MTPNETLFASYTYTYITLSIDLGELCQPHSGRFCRFSHATLLVIHIKHEEKALSG